MFAALLSFDHSEPFALDLGASSRAANHAEAVMNEPDHIVQKAFAILAFSEPRFDFLYRSVSGP